MEVCLPTHLPIYMCMYLLTCLTNDHTHISGPGRRFLYICIYIYTYTYTHTHIYVYDILYMCVCICICIHMYMHTYIYIYIYTCLHTCTHICMHILPGLLLLCDTSFLQTPPFGFHFVSVVPLWQSVGASRISASLITCGYVFIYSVRHDFFYHCLVLLLLLLVLLLCYRSLTPYKTWACC